MDGLIRVIDVLSAEDLHVVHAKVRDVQFETSGVFSGSTGLRTSSSAFLDDDSEVARLLHERINASLLTYLAQLKRIHPVFDGWPVPGGAMTRCHREALQLLRYGPGQKYVFHHDVADHPTRREYHRTISVVLYLSDDFEGGGTAFPHRVFKPKAGQALIFPSNWCYPHAGQEVISGTKFVCVTWYYVESTYPST